jgi:hypothetical protein
MRANTLRQFLGKGNLVSDTLRDTVALCQEWYAAEPSLVTFIVHGQGASPSRRRRFACSFEISFQLCA